MEDVTLDIIDDIVFVPGTRGNLRCSCCNRPNSLEISDDADSLFTKTRMVFDPRDNTRVLCMECVEIILETNSEFGTEDD